MGVLVKNNLTVDTNILLQSKNMVVNSVMELLVEITYLRELDPASLIGDRKGLEEVVYTWLHEGTLRGVLFEVSQPGNTNALEDWDVSITYRDTPDSEVKRAPTVELKRFCETLKSLPPGARYNIIMRLAPGAKEIAGWVPATKKHLTPTVEKSFGSFGYGTLEGKLDYRAETF